MRGARLPAILILAVVACPAIAELCPNCKGKAYTKDIGQCAQCQGPTSSGAFKLCTVCSSKLQQCEHCRAALGQQIDLTRSGSYIAGRWTYMYAISNPGTRSEGYCGVLAFDDRILPAPKNVNDHYPTPWGEMYWVGQPVTAFGSHGWMTKPLPSRKDGTALPVPGQAAAVYVKVLTAEEAGLPNGPAVEDWLAAELLKLGVKDAAVRIDWTALTKEYQVLHDARRLGLAILRLAPEQEAGKIVVQFGGNQESTVTLPLENKARQIFHYTLAGSATKMELYVALVVEMPDAPPQPTTTQPVPTPTLDKTRSVAQPAATPREAPRSQETMEKFQTHAWQRDPHNPVLPPGGGWFDVGCCMNPFVLRQGDEYWLFYAGADKDGHRRICLAIAPVNDLTKWRRLGPVVEPGKPGAFDHHWCVLPCVHRIGGKWHMYYTGNSGEGGKGLQAFWGIGLAVSDDLVHWKKTSDEPILRGDGFPQWPNNRGIAGGARIQEIPQAGGKVLYRMHYTLAVGTPSRDLMVDQAKYSVCADSWDGLKWFDKRVLLGPRAEAKYENVATIALNVWHTGRQWRAIYAGIGTQFGAYSICEAISQDGLTWERGKPGENLALPPQGTGWESKMTEYPNVIEEDGKLRLFYCGNGYGTTGIGTALAEKLP